MKTALRILLVAVLVYSYWVYMHLALSRPSLADYERASAYVRARFQAGDLIDVAPFWAGRVREYLGDLPLASFRHLEAEDLTRYRRVWLFSLFGAEGSAHQALAARTRLLDEQRFERIDVRLYEVLGHEPVQYDFRDRIASAHAWIAAGGAMSGTATAGGSRGRPIAPAGRSSRSARSRGRWSPSTRAVSRA
jgi:hypothetical protein